MIAFTVAAGCCSISQCPELEITTGWTSSHCEDGHPQLAVLCQQLLLSFASSREGLGARLVQRTIRKLALSEDGVVFHRRALRIAGDLGEATSELSERRASTPSSAGGALPFKEAAALALSILK